MLRSSEITKTFLLIAALGVIFTPPAEARFVVDNEDGSVARPLVGEVTYLPPSANNKGGVVVTPVTTGSGGVTEVKSSHYSETTRKPEPPLAPKPILQKKKVPQKRPEPAVIKPKAQQSPSKAASGSGDSNCPPDKSGASVIVDAETKQGSAPFGVESTGKRTDLRMTSSGSGLDIDTTMQLINPKGWSIKNSQKDAGEVKLTWDAKNAPLEDVLSAIALKSPYRFNVDWDSKSIAVTRQP